MVINRLVIVVMFILIAMPFTVAVEDFVASTDNGKIDICLGEIFFDYITVTNTGDDYSIYNVEATGDVGKQVISVREFFDLMPGQSKDVENFMIFSEEGKYNLVTQIETNQGLVKELSQEVDARLCNNNVLIANNFNQSSCPCTVLEYDFTVRNPGDTFETYVFSVDKYAKYVNVTANPLLLGPGEEADVKAYVALPCNVYGQQIINFISTARGTGIKSKVPIVLNIGECYDFDLIPGKLLDQDDTRFNESFELHEGSYSVCSGENKSIQMLVDNVAYIGNNIFYTVSGEEWAGMYNDVTSLNGHESGLTFLDVSPPEGVEGEYKFVITGATQIGDEKVQEVVDVAVEDCYGVAVELPSEALVCGCELTSVPFTVYNLGSFEENVLLSAEGENVNLSTESVTVGSKARAEESLDFLTDCSFSGRDIVTVDVSLDDSRASASDSIDVTYTPLSECYDIDIDVDSSIRLYEEKEIPVKIINTGEKEGEYSVSFSGPEFLSIGVDDFTLAPGEEMSFNLKADPSDVEAGDYGASLNISVNNVVYTKNLEFNVRDGPGFFEGIWLWIVFNRYWVVTAIVIFILLILLIFYLVDRIRVWRIRRMIDKAAKKNSKKIKKVGRKVGWWKALLIVIIVALVVFLLLAYGSLVLGFLGSVLSFILLYIWYIVIGFVILWVLIYLLGRGDK